MASARPEGPRGAVAQEVLAPMQEQPTADIAQQEAMEDAGIMSRLLVEGDHGPGRSRS